MQRLVHMQQEYAFMRAAFLTVGCDQTLVVWVCESADQILLFRRSNADKIDEKNWHA